MFEDDAFSLPDDLPEPEDDSEADHLPGVVVPSVPLPATDGTTVDLWNQSGRIVVYCYPKTGRPDKDVTPDGWDETPGVRDCTPESRGFRDHYEKFSNMTLPTCSVSRCKRRITNAKRETDYDFHSNFLATLP